MRSSKSALSVALVLVLAALAVAQAGPPAGLKTLADGQPPDDARLGPVKDLDGYFPFTPPASRQAWPERAQRVRRQMLVATGLWPMPDRTPPQAVIHGKVQREGYTVEKVFLQSYPGHFVTGNLYRPTGKTGRLPGVLCPHGHWANGRFHQDSVQTVRQSIVQGAERFEVGGRFPLQARCVELARMGCVVFHWDMVGYADSVQIPQSLAHGFAKQRPEMDTSENWGFFSAQAELRCQSIMGLQTYNSTRVLDWFSELPDVDPHRLAVTGASGGGTQTFILCAIDPRPAVAFPAVMVSTAMQGGCTCENCSLLRVDTGNIEFAGLIAPRPLGMTAANDWTKEMATKGFPELKQLYTLLGAPGNVMLTPLLHFGHNYNYVSRSAMYQWMNRHLKLGLKEPVVEEDFQPLTVAEMSVWDAEHPKPAGGLDYERSLVGFITQDARKQMDALTPKDATSLAQWRRVVGGAFDVIVGRPLPPPGAIQFVSVRQSQLGDVSQTVGLLRYAAEHEELPAILLSPKAGAKRTAVWIDPAGKAGLFGPDGTPRPGVAKLLAGGVAVLGVDLFWQGEFLADGKEPARARRVKNPREFAGYTLGYNHSVFAQRAQDVLTAIAAARDAQTKAPPAAGGVYLVALNGAGRWGAAARAQAGAAVMRAALDTGAFRFQALKAFDDLDFLPGSVKYGDLPALLALSAPDELWLAGEGKTAPALVQAAYQAAGQAGKLQVFSGDKAQVEAAAVEWLLR